MIKEDEHNEADLEYGNQRKAIMDMKEDLATVHCMVTNIFAAVAGWVCGALIFLMFFVYSRYVCKEGLILYLGINGELIKTAWAQVELIKPT